MTTFAEHERRARTELAEALTAMDSEHRLATMTDACIETGGTLVPQSVGKWGPHFAEIRCLGVYHAGNDIAEAIANWIKAVYRMEAGSADARADMVANAMRNTTGLNGGAA